MADFPPVASLRSFEAVARLGSVTQAAHELSVTHSAVSQHIKQLEALVGVTLFIRHGRGVRITEEGRLYALQIREALQHIADATRMVQIKPRTLEVTLATLPSFGCHWLLPRLARFQTRHPQIAVRLLTSLAVVNLQQEGIDLAIRMGQGDWEGMESRHLFADEQLVVAAPASWAFAKLRFAGRRFLLLGYIALMVLPFQVLMVPSYLIATRLGIYDTPLSVILPGVFSAFPVFIMTRSFQDVPNELLEAAKLDGATAWQIFWKIGVPLGYAGIFAALVLNFIEGWNAVEQPLLFLKSQSNWPLSMYMNDIVTDNLGIAMAASLLSLIPAMLVFLYGQTYLELGIQAGGIKA